MSYIGNLTLELARRNICCTILTSQHIKSLKKIDVKDGVTIKRLPILCKLGKGVIAPTLFTDGIKEIKRNDIVIVNLPQLEAGIVAIIAKLFGKKILVIHHTDLSGWSGWWNRISEAAVNFSGLISCCLAKKIIPYTMDYADSSSLLKKFKKKVYPIYPVITTAGPDKPYTDFLKNRAKTARHGLQENLVMTVGYSGRIAKQKKLEDAIEAIKILNVKNSGQQWKLLLAGPAAVGEKYGIELLEKIKGNTDVINLGPLNSAQLSSFYDFIDVLVLPSNDRLESFGLVQIEAMLHGCPIVATELPGSRIPIKLTGMGKLVPINNPILLADTIGEVVSLGRDHWKTFIPKAKKIFNNETSVESFLEILK